jgi:hypothetical protein
VLKVLNYRTLRQGRHDQVCVSWSFALTLTINNELIMRRLSHLRDCRNRLNLQGNTVLICLQLFLEVDFESHLRASQTFFLFLYALATVPKQPAHLFLGSLSVGLLRLGRVL